MKKLMLVLVFLAVLWISYLGYEDETGSAQDWEPPPAPPVLTIVFPEGEVGRSGEAGPWHYLGSNGKWRTVVAPTYALPEGWWDQEADQITAAETVQLIFEVPPAKVEVTRYRCTDGLQRFTRLEDVGTMSIDEDRAVYHIVAQWPDEGRNWYGEAEYSICIEKKE